MNIAAVDLSLADALRNLGHMVHTITPAPGVVRLAPLLGDFQPDLIVQQERLSPRVLLADLDQFSCPKVFWSIDTHLNAFWHRIYGGLFDAVCTTQLRWIPVLREELPHVTWLPWYGVCRPLPSWEERQGALFVGRSGPSRPLRQRFLAELDTIPGFRHLDDLSFDAMLAAYCSAQIVPNEAILGELNFRIFEAASCGCALITPEVPGLAELFVPGEEVLTYTHGLELLAHLRTLLAHPTQARRLGTQAFRRIHTQHLPEHRAHTLLEALPSHANAATGERASALLWRTVALLWEANMLAIKDPERLRAHLQAHAHHPEVAAALLRVELVCSPESARQRVQHLAQNLPHHPDLLATAGLAALHLGEHDAAQTLLEHGTGQTAASTSNAYVLWAEFWQHQGMACRPGFVFRPHHHVPGSALEALILAHEKAPEDMVPPQRMAELLAPWQGFEETRLGVLSFLSLRAPANWQLSAELAWTNFRAFRLREGTEELALAWENAQRQGNTEELIAYLATRDPSGHMARLLPCTPAADSGRSGPTETPCSTSCASTTSP